MLGIDATYHIPGEAIKAAGYEWVGRYNLRGAYKITPEEVTDYHANGLSIEFFGEHQADFMLGGAAAGVDAGKDAHDYLTFLGAPAGTVEFFTVDFDAQPKHFPALGAFLSAAAIELYPYLAGVYGGYAVGQAFGRGYPIHQTEAWSYRRVSEYANFFQRVGTTLPPIAGTQPGNYDENIAIRSVGLWSPVSPNPPVPQPNLGEEMYRYMIYMVNGKNVLVDMQNEKPIKIFADTTGPYGLTQQAANFALSNPQSTIFTLITPIEFAQAYPGFAV